MASDDDPNHSQDHTTSNSHTWPDDDNPFVAFRRFADEQISSMLQSVVGLPTIISPPPPDHWAIFENDAKYQRPQFHPRQNGDGGDNDVENAGQDHGSDNKPENNSSFSKSQLQSQSRWPVSDDDHRRMHRPGRHPYDISDIDFFFNSFFDKFWFDDRFSNRFFHPYHRPMFSSMVNDDSPAWPVYYLMFSPYSPLHLERQAQYRSHRERGVFSSIMSSLRPSSERDPAEPQWREAFEDLLRLENGKPMLERKPTDISKEESGRDWLQGLAKRGSLGDRWKYMAGSDGKPFSTITYEPSASKDNVDNEDGGGGNGNGKVRISWNENDQESATELDVYDRFLADIESRERQFFQGVHESPLLRLLFDERRGFGDEGGYARDEPGGTMNEWPGQSTEDDHKSVKESGVDRATSSAVETASTSPSAEQKPYVISASTSTQRIRLEDGSVETKTTKTTRFSDGREESNESVQVVNPQNGADSNSEGSGSDQNKSGWFWKGE